MARAMQGLTRGQSRPFPLRRWRCGWTSRKASRCVSRSVGRAQIEASNAAACAQCRCPACDDASLRFVLTFGRFVDFPKVGNEGECRNPQPCPAGCASLRFGNAGLNVAKRNPVFPKNGREKTFFRDAGVVRRACRRIAMQQHVDPPGERPCGSAPCPACFRAGIARTARRSRSVRDGIGYGGDATPPPPSVHAQDPPHRHGRVLRVGGTTR